MLRRTGRALASAVVRPPVARRSLRRASRAGRLPEAVWRRLPVVEPSFTVQAPGQGFVYASTPGDLLGRPLYWQGLEAWEPATVRAWCTAAAAAEGLVVDVGANTGVFSLAALAASPAVHVLALEPVPAAYDALVRNLALNGWQDRCRAEQAAADTASGRARFVLPDVPLPLSAHLEGALYRDHSGTLVDVAAVRVDDLVGDERVVLVKVDVEGAEDRVLEGMRGTLERWRPPLVVECQVEGPYRRVERLLQGLGYAFTHLGRSADLADVPTITPDPSRRNPNVLCTPAG